MDLTRIHSKQDLESLVSLIQKNMHDEFLRYPFLSMDRRARYRLGKLGNVVSSDENMVFSVGEDAAAGMIAVEKQEWGSAHFGVEMRKLDHFIVAEGPHREEIRKKLFCEAEDVCRDDGVGHLSVRVSTDDIDTVQYLLEDGYVLVDTIVTSVVNARKLPEVKLKPRFDLREATDDDLERSIAIAGEAFSHDRFHSDKGFEKDLSDDFYRKWVQKAWALEMADTIVVAERHGELVGFLTFQVNHLLKKETGINLYGSGLSAVAPSGAGAYPYLVSAALDLAHGKDIVDLETQINSNSVIKVCQYMGFHLAHSRYTLHKWLEK